MYLSWKEHDNLRYKHIRHLLEPDAEKQEKPGNADLDELQHDRPNPPAPVGSPVPLTPREESFHPPVVAEDASRRWDPATRRSKSESRGTPSVPIDPPEAIDYPSSPPGVVLDYLDDDMDTDAEAGG